jgi:hypothetical protein
MGNAMRNAGNVRSVVGRQAIAFAREIGAGEGNRTLDIQLGKLSFYH